MCQPMRAFVNSAQTNGATKAAPLPKKGTCPLLGFQIGLPDRNLGTREMQRPDVEALTNVCANRGHYGAPSPY
jgi:hypothetical protein